MDKKKSIPTNTQTRNIAKLYKDTNNIYESVMIIAKRANQIAAEQKQELKRTLDEFTSVNDSLEEVFENREQTEISKHYEKQPKAALIAIDEFMKGKIYYRLVDNKEQEETKAL